MGGLDYPIGVDGRGRLALTAGSARVRDLIERVLLTAPGERVNRPDFGSGILHLLWSPSDDAVAAAVRTTVQGALQSWLRDVIAVESVDTQSGEGTLSITVRYRLLATDEHHTEAFQIGETSRGGAG